MILSSTVSNIGSGLCFTVNWSHGRVGPHAFLLEPNMNQSWQGVGQHLSNEAHEWWRSQSSVREGEGRHSRGKNSSRGFSMTEHVESELLLLLLPGRQRNEPTEPERGNKKWTKIQRKLEFCRKNLEDNQALHWRATHSSLQLSPAASLSQSHAGLKLHFFTDPQ